MLFADSNSSFPRLPLRTQTHAHVQFAVVLIFLSALEQSLERIVQLSQGQ